MVQQKSPISLERNMMHPTHPNKPRNKLKIQNLPYRANRRDVVTWEDN
jgi:hypothetical protein